MALKPRFMGSEWLNPERGTRCGISLASFAGPMSLSRLIVPQIEIKSATIFGAKSFRVRNKRIDSVDRALG